jgi:hypothetical protein
MRVEYLCTDTVDGLDLSGAAESDGDFAGVDNDRYLPTAFRMAQHPLESIFVLEHIYVFKGNLSLGKVLPGPRSIRAKIMTKNQHFLYRHHLELLLISILNMDLA